MRLGEQLVLWRDVHGVIHVQNDRCPHRAVPLSRGINEGDRLRCNYHGVEVGPDGSVLSGARPARLPARRQEGGEDLSIVRGRRRDLRLVRRRAAMRTRPISSRPTARRAANIRTFLCYADWEMPWRYAFDNLMDPMHGTFLHANSHTMYQGDTQAHFVTRDTPHGFFFEKEGQRDVNFDWSELVDKGALYVRLEIPYPPSGGPGGNFGIVGFGTPIDENNDVRVLLAHPQGERMATRRLALPVQDQYRGAALGGSRTGPRNSRRLSRGWRNSRCCISTTPA